jgi:hypothetical protein
LGSSHTLDQLDIAFDDAHAIANAGLLLPATLAERLGIEQAADALIDLGEQAGAHRPGRKLLTLVHAMLAGADCIDDADLLRCGATSQCWATGSWPPPPWGRSCARSPSGRSASSTGSPSKSCQGVGGQRRRPMRSWLVGDLISLHQAVRPCTRQPHDQPR